MDSELEELLRDTPEPCTPLVCSPTPKRPFTLGAARITVEAANEPAVNVEAVVDRLQAVVEGLLPWLQDDISSSESSNPRTPCPDIELGEIFQFEESAQIDPEHKQLNNGFSEDDREPLRIAYQSYLNTRMRIAVIEGQFRACNNLDLLLPYDIFGPHPGPVLA